MTETEIKVGGKYRYGNNPYTALTVFVMELLPGDKARVYWHTQGRKTKSGRLYTVSPRRREKVVRLTSLKDW